MIYPPTEAALSDTEQELVIFVNWSVYVSPLMTGAHHLRRIAN
jgi:hypothetical protein